MSYKRILLIIILGLKYPSSKAIYSKSNQQAEKLCQIIHFAFTKVTIHCTMLPKFITSFVVYFTTDLGREAFELPLLMW